MIELINVRKKFNTRWVLKRVNLTIPENKTTVIIGRSGEGKSVLLKLMIGLLKPTAGKILINDKDITTVPDKDEIFQKIGYVFQAAALLDSLTVFHNIGLPLLERGAQPDEVLPIVKEKLALVNLSEDVLYKYPAELSGGMKKRVGLARTLVHNPEIILFDEPTTGLDPINARVVHELIQTMQQKLHLTAVIVSHDIESFKFADYIALLHEGEVRYTGPADTIWQTNNPFVYRFIRGLPESYNNPDNGTLTVPE